MFTVGLGAIGAGLMYALRWVCRRGEGARRTPPSQWFHLENVAWVLLGGLLISMGIILARASREWSFTTAKRSEEQLEAETHEFGGGLHHLLRRGRAVR